MITPSRRLRLRDACARPPRLRFRTRRLVLAVVALAFALHAAPAHAALVARYTFNASNGNDSSGSANTYNLAEAGPGTTGPSYLADPSGNTYLHLDGVNSGAGGQILATPVNALEANNDDGDTDWIVSLWFRTDDWSQGSSRGFFATADDANDDAGWQLFSADGTGRVGYNDGSNNTIDWTGPQPSVNDWHHLYLIKNSDADWQLYLDKNLVVDDTSDVGRVDEIRLGINRNGVNGLRLDLDFIHVWTANDDPGSDLNTVYDAGLAHLANEVPTPSAAALGLIGILALTTHRPRAST